MNKSVLGALLLLTCLGLLAGCGLFFNPATRIANSIEMGANSLGSKNGSKYLLQFLSPEGSGKCHGPYRVEFSKTGSLTVWCEDAAGRVTSTATTSEYARLVDTPETYTVNKPAGSTLTIYLERLHGRAVMIGVR